VVIRKVKAAVWWESSHGLTSGSSVSAALNGHIQKSWFLTL